MSLPWLSVPEDVLQSTYLWHFTGHRASVRVHCQMGDTGTGWEMATPVGGDVGMLSRSSKRV